MHIIFIISIIIIIFILYKDNIETFISRKHICNNIDGRCYSIVEKFNDSKKASELLAKLNLFCIKIMKHLRKKYIRSYNSNEEAIRLVKFLLQNYNPDGIIENAPSGNINTSYVDDKGKEFAICLREKISGKHKFHLFEELQFVVLHEMSHMANVNFGHNQDFWEVFKFILQEAALTGLYIPINYEKYPLNYCSLEVTHNPYFDKSIRNIKIN